MDKFEKFPSIASNLKCLRLMVYLSFSFTRALVNLSMEKRKKKSDKRLKMTFIFTNGIRVIKITTQMVQINFLNIESFLSRVKVFQSPNEQLTLPDDIFTCLLMFIHILDCFKIFNIII